MEYEVNYGAQKEKKSEKERIRKVWNRFPNVIWRKLRQFLKEIFGWSRKVGATPFMF